MPDDKVYLPSDPQGLYAVLGVGPLADAVEIRAAFRKKVKLVHPDFNPAEDAPLRFQSLTNAYRILRDPSMRTRYDTGAIALAPLSTIDFEDDEPDPLPCSRCGKVTAQPRYLVFYRVKSFLWRARRTSIRGIFCRDCADRTVIKASTLTWLQGWWAIDGPWRTVQALWTNLKGGERPQSENLRVILHQARAFLSLGETDIAWSLAAQADPFASNAHDRAHIREIRDEAGTPTRRLRDRWSPWNGAAVVQALPLAAMLLAIGVAAAVPLLQSQTDDVSAGITVRLPKAGEVRHVAVELLKLRQGASVEAPVLEILDRFTTVKVVDTAPGGEWTRVTIPSGVSGFVPARYLFAGAGDEPKRRWCDSNRGEPPKSGDVLLRRTGGNHRATITNDTGADAIVRLKTSGGQTLLALYIAAGQDAILAGIPDGNFRLTFATGSGYSRACAVFLENMQSFIFDAPQIFVSGSRANAATMRLPAPGDETVLVQPYAAEQFVD
ncbi:MAG TPA: DnaJ domain-containing protein [Magnetospirillaceae bacterium]|jgi:hypothetical protein